MRIFKNKPPPPYGRGLLLKKGGLIFERIRYIKTCDCYMYVALGKLAYYNTLMFIYYLARKTFIEFLRANYQGNNVLTFYSRTPCEP